MRNESAFTEKTVLDIGCGTGILSMFAVSAGAENVFAIDNSDIILYTHDIIRYLRRESYSNPLLLYIYVQVVFHVNYLII